MKTLTCINCLLTETEDSIPEPWEDYDHCPACGSTDVVNRELSHMELEMISRALSSFNPEEVEFIAHSHVRNFTERVARENEAKQAGIETNSNLEQT